MGALADRRADTTARIGKIVGKLQGAERFAKGKACIFATGSYGRGEATSHSDLDLFIVGKTGPGKRSLLKPLEEICVKAELVRTTRALKIKDFSLDGRYLTHFSVYQFTKTLGTERDDVTNTFTARLLLLLESRPLVESAVYEDVIEEVIGAYWRDYKGREAKFMPAFLANDILRLWRTFCVNYEARTARVPPKKKAKGKLHNYKLKHSRLLTCYSALLYLLAVYRRHGTVSPLDALVMIKMSPTERLEWLLAQRYLADAHDAINKLLTRYERFLRTTSVGETDLIKQFMDRKVSRSLMKEAYKFGDLVFQAVTIVGKGDSFHRMLVV